MAVKVGLLQLLDCLRKEPYGFLLLSSGQDAITFPAQYETLQWIGGVSSKKSELNWPKKNSWQFGFLGYDYKNRLHHLSSAHPAFMDWPESGWIEPEWLGYQLDFSAKLELPDYSDFQPWKSGNSPVFKPQFGRLEYEKKVEQVRDLIRKGIVYELNLCQAFQSEDVPTDPMDLFFQIRATKPVSFSALVKWEHRWLLCFSPERFLRKENGILMSQPIKGTRARGNDPEMDSLTAKELKNSVKDKAENVMIVDLVRNDLSRICKTGTVEVPDLMNVYSFPTVHQMISTIQGTLKESVEFEKIIEACFPMGSMTGAPKREALIQIDKLEGFSRNLFSGSVGYLTPNGNFDFNVLIRSLYVNEEKNQTHCFAGGAITYHSDPQAEYEESLLKAEPLIQMAGGILERT